MSANKRQERILLCIAPLLNLTIITAMATTTTNPNTTNTTITTAAPPPVFDYPVDSYNKDTPAAFLRGYYNAHVDLYFNNTYNANKFAPHNNTMYDQFTGKKIVQENATQDYIAGYQWGWDDGKHGRFYTDC